MQNAIPGKPQINPRLLLKQKDGVQRLAAILQANAGYVPQTQPLKALKNAVRRFTPLLCEGTRGSGKTALAESLGMAFNLPIFYVQCMVGLTMNDVLFEWDRAAQSQFVEQQVGLGVDLEKAQAEQWTKSFLNLGEVLAAFDYAATSLYPPVLIIDEIDKLDETGEDTLLQILARGYAHVPRLKPDSRIGMLPESSTPQRRQSYPIIVLTSNNMRGGVSSPLRSRCRYTYIKHPSAREEVCILLSRVPSVSRNLLYQTVQLMNGIRRMSSIVEKPGLRESIEFLDTIVEDKEKEITADVIMNNVDCLAKCETDVENFETGLARLEQIIRVESDKDVWAMVDAAFALKANAHRLAAA